MDNRQGGSPDFAGVSAVLASASAVVLVVVATVTDRPVLLGVAALVVAAAVALMVVRRSTSRLAGPAGGPHDGSAHGPDVLHDDDHHDVIGGEADNDGSAERYRGEAVTARADLLATLRHGFRNEVDPGSGLTDSPTESETETGGDAEISSRGAFMPNDHQPTDAPAGPAPRPPDSFTCRPSATPMPGPGADVVGNPSPDPLFDPATGLFTQGFFEASLPKRVSAARRGLRPLSLAVVDVVVGHPVAQATTADRAVVAEAMIDVFRDADTIAIADDGRFLILLEDTQEDGTVWTLERLRRQLTADNPDHTMWAGVSCYPAYSFDADGLIAQAREALESARQWQQDRIEIAAHAAD